MKAIAARAYEIYEKEGAVSLLESATVFLRDRVHKLRRVPKNLRLEYKIRQRGSPVFEREIRGSTMRLNARNSGIEQGLILNGDREQATADYLEGVFGELDDRYGDDLVVLDIGANIGFYALLEARVLGGDIPVYAFEPHPRNVDDLQKNVSLNGYDSVEVIPKAVSSGPGTLELSVTGSGNTHHLSHIRGGLETDRIPVDVTSVDNELADIGLDDDDFVAVRIDVEGAENEVFEGMADLFESDRSAFIAVEIHRRPVGDENVDWMLDQLREHDFELTRVAVDGGETLVEDVGYEALYDRESNFHIMAIRE